MLAMSSYMTLQIFSSFSATKYHYIREKAEPSWVYELMLSRVNIRLQNFQQILWSYESFGSPDSAGFKLYLFILNSPSVLNLNLLVCFSELGSF